MARYIDTDIQSIKAGKCHDVKVKQDAVDDHNVAKAKFDKAAKKSMDNAANRTKFIGRLRKSISTTCWFQGENIASLKNLEREVTLKIQKQKMIDAVSKPVDKIVILVEQLIIQIRKKSTNKKSLSDGTLSTLLLSVSMTSIESC